MLVMSLIALLSTSAEAGTRRTFEPLAVFDGQLVGGRFIEDLASASRQDLLAGGTCGTWDGTASGGEEMHGTCVFLELGVPSTSYVSASGDTAYRKTQTLLLEDTPCVGTIGDACFNDTYRIVSREITYTVPVTSDSFTLDGVDVTMPRQWQSGWRQTRVLSSYRPGVVYRGVQVRPASLRRDIKTLQVFAQGGSFSTTMSWAKQGGVWTDHGSQSRYASETDSTDHEAECRDEAEAAVDDFESSWLRVVVADWENYVVHVPEIWEHLKTASYPDVPEGVRKSSYPFYQDAYDRCMEREEALDECDEPVTSDPLYTQTDDGGDNPCD